MRCQQQSDQLQNSDVRLRRVTHIWHAILLNIYCTVAQHRTVITQALCRVTLVSRWFTQISPWKLHMPFLIANQWVKASRHLTTRCIMYISIIPYWFYPHDHSYHRQILPSHPFKFRLLSEKPNSRNSENFWNMVSGVTEKRIVLISVGLPNQPTEQPSTQSLQPPQFYARCQSCHNPPNLSRLGTGTEFFCWFWPSDFWMPSGLVRVEQMVQINKELFYVN